MRRAILFLFPFLLSFSTYSQLSNSSSDQDSILSLIRVETDTAQKVQHFLDLIRIYQNTNLEQAIEYGEKAVNLAVKTDNEALIIEAKTKLAVSYGETGRVKTCFAILDSLQPRLKKLKNNSLTGANFLAYSYIHSIKGNFSESMHEALTALKYFKMAADTLGLARAYNNIGVNYDITGNSQEALDNYLKSMQYAKAINNDEMLSNLFNNIGIIYDLLNDNDEALVYYYKALEISNKMGDMKSSAGTLTNMASLFLELDRTTEALANYRKALQIVKEAGDKSGEALIYSNLAELYIEIKQPDSVEFYLRKSLGLRASIKDNYGLAEVYLTLGAFFLDNEKTQQAINPIKKAYQLSTDIGVAALSESAASHMAKIFAKQKNYKKAYEFQLKAKEISDSLIEKSKNEQLKYSDLQIEMNERMSSFEEELSLNDSMHEKEMTKQKREKRLIAIMLIGIFMFSLVIFLNFRRSHKINNQLIKKNREIEEQKALVEVSNLELFEQHRFTETLLNTIPNPVFYTDKQNKLLGCNKAFEHITNHSISDMAGMKLEDLSKNTDFGCQADEVLTIAGKGRVRNEAVVKFADGKRHDIICYKNSITDSDKKCLGIVGIIIDITDIKRAEKSIIQSEKKLREAINSKDKFFNIMAHDLKNPFNAVLGLTGLIADNFESHTQKEVKRLIHQVNKSATQIYNLLENLLEWARAQSGSIEKNATRFSISEPIQECIVLFNHAMDVKHIKLEYTLAEELFVFADKNMILTVVRNLLSNAIKYTPEHGQIKIEVKNIKKFAEVTITDSGVGIDPLNIDKLFKIDQPITTPGVDNEKGTGLGLIICKEFIKNNGGKIYATSLNNKGASFTFTIPLVNK